MVFDAFLVPRVGDRPIDQITPDVVRELDAELAKRGAARSTRRNMQLALRSVLCRFCVERRLLPEPPPMPKLPRVGNHVLRVPTDDEVTRIFGVVPERFHLALLIGRFAGLRAGEIRALRWRHVDLSRGHLVVEESTCRGVTDVPKSGHQRIIPLAAPLMAALSAVPRRPREGFVTCGPDGKPWSEDALSKAFSRYAKRALVEGVSLHSLRHHFVTTLFKPGVGAPTVQALAGHLHLSTTQRYAHALQVDLVDAIRKLDGNVRGNSVVTDPERG